MKKEIVKYMANCKICQQVKVENQKFVGQLQLLIIAKCKWEDITIDFVSRLLRGKKVNNAISIIMDQLTKSTLFIPIKMTNSVDKLAKLYVNEVVKLHEMSISIVSNQDPRFKSWLWPNI